MNKKRCNTLLPLVQLLPAVAAAAAVLFALPRTVPVLAAVPERLTAVVEQPVEAASSEAEEEALPKLPYADGVYVGSSRGYGGTVRVQVTMENGSITEVEILDASHETKQFLRRAKRLLTTVVDAQSWEVDAVSEATYTSRGILGAVQNALTGEVVNNHLPPQPKPAAPLVVEEFTAPSTYLDGIYTAEAIGFEGKITVQVTVAEDKITDITVLSAEDEEEYLSRAKRVMPGAFVAGFSGVKQIFLHIGAGEVLSADSFTLSLLGLCGFTLLFDRFFCGYACAFGSLGDAVWALSGLLQKKLFHRKKQLRLPERAVLWGQKVKYLLLAGLVALYVTRQEQLMTGASPWEVFSRLTALRLPPEGFGVGIALLVLILLGMAVQPRFFCQFLCPMGAVFALLPVLPFARLHRQSEGCIPGCNACKQQCPVCLKLEESSLRSGECIACEACVGTCPKQNIHRWDTALCKHQWLPVLGKALLFFLLGCWLGFCRFI